MLGCQGILPPSVDWAIPTHITRTRKSPSTASADMFDTTLAIAKPRTEALICRNWSISTTADRTITHAEKHGFPPRAREGEPGSSWLPLFGPIAVRCCVADTSARAADRDRHHPPPVS